MQSLKFTHYDIVFQEVPNETTLVFNISGCPHKCEGCHSSYLGEYVGEYLLDNIEDIVSKYEDKVTCVCFMGGDQNLIELEKCLTIVKEHSLKTCVYSGADELDLFRPLFFLLNYLKIGRYNQLLGGLDKSTTNQIFYQIEHEKQYNLTDKTYLFRKDTQ